MKIMYSDSLHLSQANKSRLIQINTIVDEYHKQGYKLTLRQLYYQLVSRDIIPNKPDEYSKLSSVLVKGRMAGVVDWDAIEDRVRVPKLPYWTTDVNGAIRDITRQYRLDRMRTQDVYIEVWVEKDALSGVLSRITNKYHIRLMVNRGYSSATAMHDAAERIIDSNKDAYILYLGDHDPSGMDMIRDMETRLLEFDADVTVVPIALTDDQIAKYHPPPNPAKFSDPRAKWYVEKYGESSWEVDALPPAILNELLDSSIRELIDIQAYIDVVALEKEHVEKLIKFAEGV